MGAKPRVWVALFSALVLMGLAGGPLRAGEDEPEQGKWDDVAGQVISQLHEKNADLSTLVRYLRKVSCRIDVRFTTNESSLPLTATLTYAWEDANDSGAISGNELEIETERLSNRKFALYVKDLRTKLERMTLAAGLRLFTLADATGRRIEGGYELKLTPVRDRDIQKMLGFSVARLKITDDLRGVELTAKNDEGDESVVKFRHTKWGDLWLSSGYVSTSSTQKDRSEEDRTIEYTEMDGVPLPKRVVVHFSKASPLYAVTIDEVLTFRDWKIEKRAKPLPPRGASHVAATPKEPGPTPKPQVPEPPQPVPLNPVPPRPEPPKAAPGGLFDDSPLRATPRPEEGKALPPGIDPSQTSNDPAYGYTKEKPIQVGTQPKSRKTQDVVEATGVASYGFLDRLRDAKLRPFRAQFNAELTKGAQAPDGHPLLVFDLTDADGARRTLYIDPFHPEAGFAAAKAPKGMYLQR